MPHKGVQLRAMLRKDWLQMKAEKKKMFSEIFFSCGYGCLIGYELSLQFENEDLMGLGHLMLILMCPIIFQQSSNYIGNQMVKDRETKMKETLKIMGCESWIYALSFMIQRGVWMIFPTIFVSIFIFLFNQDNIEFG